MSAYIHPREAVAPEVRTPRLAVFDFDGTLLRHDSVRVVALPALRSGLITLPVAIRVVSAFLAYKLGLIQRAVANQVGLQVYRGRPIEHTMGLLDALTPTFLAALSPVALAALRAHQAAGDITVIATATAEILPANVARHLGIHHVLGTRLETQDGCYNGRCVDGLLEGEAKRAAVAALATQLGFTMDQTTFYSDSHHDLPLLEAVGLPVAVGPEPRLRRFAKDRGWRMYEHDDAAPTL